jgi:hypothetical protein
MVVAAPLWLPLPGLLLVDTEPVVAADAVLLLDGTGPRGIDGVEGWRQTGLVRTVVIVEAPVKTHLLVAYWSDFVQWGLARPSPTPGEFLHVVRADSPRAAEQARAALPVLQDLGVRSVLVPGGGLGSRVVRREVTRVLSPAGISAHVVSMAPPERDAGQWYLDADDRRNVLSLWLELALPTLSEGPGVGASRTR